MSELGRELRRQSGRMAAQQRMLRSVIEALPDPIMVVDQELTVVQANAAARRSFDAPAPPVPLARILRDPGVLAAATAALAGTSASSVSFSPSHDRTKQFSARIEPVDLGDGGRGALLAHARADRAGDDRADALGFRRQRQPRDPHARSPRSRASSRPCAEPARHDAKARESFLEIMAEEADRMARLVDDLLSLSRIELAAHQPPRERVRPARGADAVRRPDADRRRARAA